MSVASNNARLDIIKQLFPKDIANIIDSYHLKEPIHKVIFNCKWCDSEITHKKIFDNKDPKQWEIQCHPYEWGSHHVTAKYTIETDDEIKEFNYTEGHCYYSDDEIEEFNYTIETDDEIEEFNYTIETDDEKKEFNYTIETDDE